MFLAALFIATMLLLQAAQAVSPAEGIAITIAGVVAPLLAQLVKRFTDVSGNAALAITVVVSAAVALVAMHFTGEIQSFGDVLKQIGSVFAIATVVYKLFMAPAPAK